jgi:hypothetical protein
MKGREEKRGGRREKEEKKTKEFKYLLRPFRRPLSERLCKG